MAQRRSQSAGGSAAGAIATDEDFRWKYQPLKSQRRFHADVVHRFKGYSGPVGTGKSKALVYEGLIAARMNPGCIGLLGAPDFPMLRSSVREHLQEITHLEGIEYRNSTQDNAVTFGNGSKIFFRSLDNFEHLRGPNLAWFGIDELTYCRPEAWLRLEARIRAPEAERIGGFAVWTPRGYDWVYRKFIEERDPRYSLVRAEPGENTYLPEDFYTNLAQSYDDRFYRQEVLGEYLDIAGGSAYHAFSRANLLEVEYDPRVPLCWAIDFNVEPMCSVIAQVHDFSSPDDIAFGRPIKQIHVLCEVVIPQDANTEMLCRAFMQRSERWANYRGLEVKIYGDASGYSRKTSGKTDYQIIKEFFRSESNYRISMHTGRPDSERSNPAVRDRINAVNGALCDSGGRHSLYIDWTQCTELVRDFQMCKFKRDSNKNVLNELDKTDSKRTHVSDALGYLIWREAGFLKSGGMRREVIT